MSILGYSAAYFLPQYWSETPLYGEKISPLLDYVLSADYQHTEKLASAFYDIENSVPYHKNAPQGSALVRREYIAKAVALGARVCEMKEIQKK